MGKQDKELLGIIGGLGPGATAYFMDLVTSMTEAHSDQEHLNMIVYSTPSIPDRTNYILGKSNQSPLPELISTGRKLTEQGATLLAIPCVTAHYFYDSISSHVEVPIINMVQETVRCLKNAGITEAGIMATDGTIAGAIFSREMQHQKISPIVPSHDRQQDVMRIIYENIKAGKRIEMDRFSRVEDELREKGAQVMILGCTELSLLKRGRLIGPGYIDAMEVLAQQTIVRCGAKLKNQYQNLIT